MILPSDLKKENKQSLIDLILEFDKQNVDLTNQVRIFTNENRSILHYNAELVRENDLLKKKLLKKKKSISRRIKNDQRKREDKQVALSALFSIYSTVLLENNWNDRIEWKNDLLQEIQFLIQDLS